MKTKSKNFDEYISHSKGFAKPILKHLRQLVHQACPDVEEVMKWNFPHFMYHGILCSMAAFQEHCAFTFWKGSLMKDNHQIMDKNRESSMGQFGRLTSLKDLPPESLLVAYIQEAMKLNQEDVKLPKKTTSKTKSVVPEDFLAAMKKNEKALQHFENLSASKQQDYVEWIIEAKQQATREKRLTTALEWLSEGKSRNWKYE